METVGSKVAAVILCGGKSRRMGSCKAHLPFGSETMLQRMVRIVSERFSPVTIVAATGQSLPPLSSEHIILRDRHEGRGPLEGLACGLSYLKSLAGGGHLEQTELALVQSIDSPFVSDALLRRLLLVAGSKEVCDSDAVIFRDSQHCYPLNGLYRLSVADLADGMLKRHQFRVLDLLNQIRTTWIDIEREYETNHEAEAIQRSLINVNTPGEYEIALKLAGLPKQPFNPDDSPGPQPNP